MSSMPDMPQDKEVILTDETVQARLWNASDAKRREPANVHAYLERLLALRIRESAFYEKLALLNGSTIALTVTAILGGGLHHRSVHKYTLAAGLVCLLLSLILFLIRNWAALDWEWRFCEIWEDWVRPDRTPDEEAEVQRLRPRFAGNVMSLTEVVGTISMGVGMTLLVFVVVSLTVTMI